MRRRKAEAEIECVSASANRARDARDAAYYASRHINTPTNSAVQCSAVVVQWCRVVEGTSAVRCSAVRWCAVQPKCEREVDGVEAAEVTVSVRATAQRKEVGAARQQTDAMLRTTQ